MARPNSKVGLAGRFLQHVVPGVIRPIHALWNEVIGFIFIVLAVWAAPSAWRSIRKYDGDSGSFLKAAISVGFALLMAWFAFTSFRKARKISRS